MSEDRIKTLEKLLEREKKARQVLEEEVEERARKLYVAYEHQQKMFDSVGIAIIHCSCNGEFINSNFYSRETIFKNRELSKGDDILEFLRLNNFPVKKEDLDSLVDHDLELVFLAPEGRKMIMGARFTRLDRLQPCSELLLSMKDLGEIRKKDEEIKELQNKLVDSAYRDGVAENAVAVLHNIGNILTLIMGKVSDRRIVKDNELLSSVLKRMDSSLASSQIGEDLLKVSSGDPRSKAMPKIIHELAKTADANNSKLSEMMEEIKQHCTHISSVITAQQNYANFKDKSKCDFVARQILSDCLVMHNDRMSAKGIEVVIGDFPFTHIYMEKIGFAQTLNNALTNAIEAIDERFRKDSNYIEKKIAIGAVAEGDNLIIDISDNGIGIEQESLLKLFAFGFSTKNRSSGFGLHNCSNFMNSNGGRMEILSAGSLKGATTKLYCPINK